MENKTNYIYNDFCCSKRAQRILQKLELLGWNLSTAESCTGGKIADYITNIPNASKTYKGGIISYTEEIKQQELNVSRETLEKYSVYSKECVKEMAEGIAQKFKTTTAISISGIAGPSGATKEIPVGGIFFCLKTPKSLEALYIKCDGNREDIKRQATLECLTYVDNRLHKLATEIITGFQEKEEFECDCNLNNISE